MSTLGLTNDSHKLRILLFLLAGLLLRGVLAFLFFGTADVEIWDMYSAYWLTQKPLYDPPYYFNYAPPWYFFIILATEISKLTWLPFFTTIKCLLSVWDLANAVCIWKIATLMKVSPPTIEKIVFAFALNPVSILVTGFHGQFDSIASFFTLLAIYWMHKPAARWNWMWALISYSTGVMFKHFIVLLAGVFAFCQNNTLKKIFWFLGTPALFALSLVPFLAAGQIAGVQKIFDYSISSGYWGWCGIIARSLLFLFNYDIIREPWFLYTDYLNVGIQVLCIVLPFFWLKKWNIIECTVRIFLFFYICTTQMAPQYTVWIIPFAAFIRGKYFWIYSVVGSLQILAFFYCHHHWHFKIPIEGFLPNLIPETFVILRYLTWLVCVLWLLELMKSPKSGVRA